MSPFVQYPCQRCGAAVWISTATNVGQCQQCHAPMHLQAGGVQSAGPAAVAPSVQPMPPPMGAPPAQGGAGAWGAPAGPYAASGFGVSQAGHPYAGGPVSGMSQGPWGSAGSPQGAAHGAQGYFPQGVPGGLPSAGTGSPNPPKSGGGASKVILALIGLCGLACLGALAAGPLKRLAGATERPCEGPDNWGTVVNEHPASWPAHPELVPPSALLCRVSRPNLPAGTPASEFDARAAAEVDYPRGIGPRGFLARTLEQAGWEQHFGSTQAYGDVVAAPDLLNGPANPESDEFFTFFRDVGEGRQYMLQAHVLREYRRQNYTRMAFSVTYVGDPSRLSAGSASPSAPAGSPPPPVVALPAPRVVQAPPVAADVSAPDLSGRWSTLFGGASGAARARLSLVQAGASVTGRYHGRGGSGSVSGAANGLTLRGTWRDRSGAHGSFTWIFTPDRSQFTGEWSYAGSSRTDSWSGTREP